MIWIVQDFEARPVNLGLSSAGQGYRPVTAIRAGGVSITNALELLEVCPEQTQVEVCECGITQCAEGGWVSMKRLGNHVVWVPAWEDTGRHEADAVEYAPPPFIESLGAPVFTPECWGALRVLNYELPRVEQLQEATARDLVRVCQWAAPGKVLGVFPEVPRLRRELLVVVSVGDIATQAALVDRCRAEHFESREPMRIEPAGIATPIEFSLDLVGTPGCVGFARVGERVCLSAGGGLVLTSAES